MYKVVGKEDDMFKVLDMDTGEDELLSAKELVLALGVAEIDGCKHSRNGIEVWYDGVEPYEIAIEVWKPVVSYNLLLPSGRYKYEVSNLGSLRRNEYTDSRGHARKAGYASTHRDKNGYRYVSLCRGIDDKKSSSVHVLVGEAFCFNKYGHKILNHLNETPGDDWAGNLCWCTYKENANWGTAKERRIAKILKPVRQYSIDGELIAEYKSAKDASDSLKSISHISIQFACKRTEDARTRMNFIWRYTDDDELYELSVSDRKTFIRNNIVPVLRQYSMDGDLVREFTCVADAALMHSCSSDAINLCLSRVSKTSCGFIWRWSNNDEFAGTVLEVNNKHKNGLKEYPVRQYTMTGVLVEEFDSVSKASDLTGLRRSHISRCCSRSGCISAGGFLWRYVFDDELALLDGQSPFGSLYPKAIHQYSLDCLFIAEYKTAADAGRVTKAIASSILRVCKRDKGFVTSGGYIWRFVSDDEFADRPENVKAIEEWRQTNNV